MSGPTKTRQCGTKVRHTKANAKATALFQRRRWMARVFAYRCPHCGFWHVGHRRNPVRRRTHR